MKMNKNILTIILLILLLLDFTIIFKFSSQNSEKSSGVSRAVTATIIKPIVEKLNQKDLVIFEAVIRKLAHFSLYLSVGVLTMSLMVINIKGKEKKQIFYSFVIGVLYAISDEIHQLFVPGRAAAVTDVLIDACRSDGRHINYYYHYKVNIDRKYQKNVIYIEKYNKRLYNITCIYVFSTKYFKRRSIKV